MEPGEIYKDQHYPRPRPSAHVVVVVQMDVVLHAKTHVKVHVKTRVIRIAIQHAQAHVY